MTGCSIEQFVIRKKWSDGRMWSDVLFKKRRMMNTHIKLINNNELKLIIKLLVK